MSPLKISMFLVPTTEKKILTKILRFGALIGEYLMVIGDDNE
jgi:hypothetical protein